MTILSRVAPRPYPINNAIPLDLSLLVKAPGTISLEAVSGGLMVDAMLASQSAIPVHQTTVPVSNMVPSDNVSSLAMHATI